MRVILKDDVIVGHTFLLLIFSLFYFVCVLYSNIGVLLHLWISLLNVFDYVQHSCMIEKMPL